MHDFTLADQDWIRLRFSKILRIRTGSDSISSYQDWTRTEKFHSLLISATLTWLFLRCLVTVWRIWITSGLFL